MSASLGSIITAIVTPFDAAGKVDEEGFVELLDHLAANGSDGFVVCGTTGEAATLSIEEHLGLIELAVSNRPEGTSIIAGAGSNDTRHAVLMTERSTELGADAILSVTPYYNRPNRRGIVAHYEEVVKATDRPIILYNIPPRAIVEIGVELMARLAKHPNIIGVKDATANLMRPSRERHAIGKDWLLLSGEDGTALAYMAHGGHGCISVTANVAPKLCSQFQTACLAGDYAAALAIQDKLLPLHDALFTNPNPAPVKYAASQLGLCSADVRLPLVEADEGSQAKVREALAFAGLK